MTVQERLERWKDEGAVTAEQQARLVGLVREEPFSIFLELNVLLYVGVLAFVTGLGWTVTRWSKELGDVAIVGALSALLLGCFWYCFRRVGPWSRGEMRAASPVVDYVLYLGCLVWCVELGYVEMRFHVLSGHWDWYLLGTAVLFFLLAYRFDNRFVLSLALSSLAGWFGLKVSHWVVQETSTYRRDALVYCAVVWLGGVLLKRLEVKPHLFGTYLNVVANVLFVAVLSRVFLREGNGVWVVALLVAFAASLAWGVGRREFAFVAYAAVYGYVGMSSLVLRGMHDDIAMYGYFVVTGVAMVAGLVAVARRFGRAA